MISMWSPSFVQVLSDTLIQPKSFPWKGQGLRSLNYRILTTNLENKWGGLDFTMNIACLDICRKIEADCDLIFALSPFIVSIFGTIICRQPKRHHLHRDWVLASFLLAARLFDWKLFEFTACASDCPQISPKFQAVQVYAEHGMVPSMWVDFLVGCPQARAE